MTLNRTTLAAQIRCPQDRVQLPLEQKDGREGVTDTSTILHPYFVETKTVSASMPAPTAMTPSTGVGTWM